MIPADGVSLSYVDLSIADNRGTLVPLTNNEISVSVSGPGKVVGMDNGEATEPENMKASSRAAYDGKAVVIIQSTGASGPIVVSASSPGLASGNATVVATNATGAGVGSDTVVVRSQLGLAINLPSTVTVDNRDGTQTQAGVAWGAVPAAAATTAGVYTVSGTIAGFPSLTATAVLTVYTVSGVNSYSTVVGTGDAPTLPAFLTVNYSDGISLLQPVTWGAVSPSQYAAPGQFIVQGTIAGVPAAQQPVASVRVASATLSDLSLSSLTPAPTASVSYTATNATPAQMIDGSTASGGWTNQSGSAASADGGDWAAVTWPSAQLIKSINVYFTVSATRSTPNSTSSPIEIDAWDGQKYVPVSYSPFTYSQSSTTPTTITLTSPVQTSKLRLWMATSAPLTSTGWIQIQELQAMGDLVTKSSVASLSSISLNGVPLAGFDPNTTSYSVGVNPAHVPVITATAASNGSVSIQTPQSSPGTATITVTSEDGTATQTYTLSLVPDTTPTVTTATINGVPVPPGGTLTVSAPAVLTLSAVDPGTPSGVAATYYSINQPKGVGGILYTPGSPVVIDPLTNNGTTSTGGQITLRWWSVDNAGNIEDPSVTLLILPNVPTTVSGNVPSTLAVSVGTTAPNLGAFVAGLTQTYTTALGATVTTTAATSTFTAADTSTQSPGHLVNTTASGGPYALAKGLQVDATDSSGSTSGGGTYSDLSLTNPATLLTFGAPVANDPVTIGFRQPIGATDPLRTGTYTKTITFTLSTNTP